LDVGIVEVADAERALVENVEGCGIVVVVMVVMDLLLHLRLLAVALRLACMVLLLVSIEAQHLARREDGRKGGSKGALVAVRHAHMSIHDSVNVCVFPSKVIGRLEWRPPTAFVWPCGPDRDAHRLVRALAGDSEGWRGVDKVDMEPRLGLGGGRRWGDRTRAACLCGRHRTYWEIDGANESEVDVHAGDHLACLVGCMGVVERGEGCERIDGDDDKNARFERCSVERTAIVQAMGHGAQGEGLREESKEAGREGERGGEREGKRGGERRKLLNVRQ
jgi:hypothetical protein